ncbi:MAG: hypothetical protein AAGF12_17815 [Myxococcota bacterium]
MHFSCRFCFTGIPIGLLICGCSLVIDSGQYVGSTGDAGVDRPIDGDAQPACPEPLVQVEDECLPRCGTCPNGIDCDPSDTYCLVDDCDRDGDGYLSLDCPGADTTPELVDCDDDDSMVFPGSLRCGAPDVGCIESPGVEPIVPRVVVSSDAPLAPRGAQLSVAARPDETFFTFLEGLIGPWEAMSGGVNLREVPSVPQVPFPLDQEIGAGIGLDAVRSVVVQRRGPSVQLAALTMQPRIVLSRFDEAAGGWITVATPSFSDANAFSPGGAISPFGPMNALDAVVLDSNRRNLHVIDETWGGQDPGNATATIQVRNSPYLSAVTNFVVTPVDSGVAVTSIQRQRSSVIGGTEATMGRASVVRTEGPFRQQVGVDRWLVAVPIRDSVHFLWFGCIGRPVVDCLGDDPAARNLVPGAQVDMLTAGGPGVAAGYHQPPRPRIELNPSGEDLPGAPLLRPVSEPFEFDVEDLRLAIRVRSDADAPIELETFGVERRIPVGFQILAGGTRFCSLRN